VEVLRDNKPNYDYKFLKNNSSFYFLSKNPTKPVSFLNQRRGTLAWHLAGNLGVGGLIPAPPTTFDPRLPKNSQRNDSQPRLKMSVIIDFARLFKETNI